MPPKKRPANEANVKSASTGNKKAATGAPVAAAAAVASSSGPALPFVPSVYVKLYRSTPVGKALTESLDELLAADKITEEMALQILSQFDASMWAALKAKARTDLTFSGHLDEYRLVDNVWTWVLTNASLSFGSRTVRTPRLKIVAMKDYEKDTQ